MSNSLLAVGIIGILLLLTLVWLSVSKVGGKVQVRAASDLPPGRDWQHISYLPQIQQALAETDFKYLSAVAPRRLVSEVRKDRQHIAIAYLSALREEFIRLLDFARIVAAMSPEVAVAQELRGARLHFTFTCRYYLIYLRLKTGFAPFDALSALSNSLSSLSIRMETAMREVGERAATSGLASSFDGGGLDTH